MTRTFTRPLAAAGTVAAMLLIVCATLLSPAVLSLIASWPTDRRPFLGTNWPLASTAGQAYGAVSAVLAGLALVAIAFSLAYQARQTRIAQLQSARSMQVELFALAYEYPELRAGWSAGGDVPFDRWKVRSYMNLVFQYLSMDHQMGTLSDAGLRRNMSNRFSTQLGRDYWATARSAWEISATNRRKRRFYRIADEAYAAALLEPPSGPPIPPGSDGSDGSDARLSYGRIVKILAVGVGVGISAREIVRLFQDGRRRS